MHAYQGLRQVYVAIICAIRGRTSTLTKTTSLHPSSPHARDTFVLYVVLHTLDACATLTSPLLLRCPPSSWSSRSSCLSPHRPALHPKQALWHLIPSTRSPTVAALSLSEWDNSHGDKTSPAHLHLHSPFGDIMCPSEPVQRFRHSTCVPVPP